MKTPEALVPALDSGIIQEVVRPLMSGKEAQIYVVVAGGIECVAKVYKEASQRTFKHRAEYTEGRRTRNSRDQRAVSKRTRHGRKQDEAGWRSTEVDMIYRLRDAGVRVPEPINFVDGVLVMELVKDADGDPAPRLGDLRFEADEATQIYQQLVREAVRMLSAGVVHGDLSDFNVLMAEDGPVVIDFPQAVDAASNQNARKLLIRDVENLHRFVKRHAPETATRPYAEEMWSLYEAGQLEPGSELRGDYRAPESKADIAEVVTLIEDADRDEGARQEARGEEPPVATVKPRRTVVDFTIETKRRRRRRRGTSAGREPGAKTASSGEANREKRPEHRRRNRVRNESGETAPNAQSRAKPSTQPSKPGAEPRGTGSTGGADRPARRRRRRPRRPD
jgi:RIO kinase 1